jgi:hypothetical protein
MEERVMVGSVIGNLVKRRLGAASRPSPAAMLPSSPAAAADGVSPDVSDDLSPEKISSLLRWYGSKECRPRIPIAAVAGLANLSRAEVYRARDGMVRERTRRLLSRALSSIERGEVSFRRVGQQWQVDYHDVKAFTPMRTIEVDDSPAAVWQRLADSRRTLHIEPLDIGGLVINVCTRRW